MTRAAPPPDLAAQVARAFEEDVGSGDLTAALVPAGRRGSATVLTREQAVLCGQPWFDEVFRQVDAAVRVTWHVAEGAEIGPGERLCSVEGPARALLTGERSALNFLQSLSGTATTTRRYGGAGRPALPHPRHAQDAARAAPRAEVRRANCAGGRNHRMGLYDGILVKENHILAAGSIAAAVQAARQAGASVPVEVEVETSTSSARRLRPGPTWRCSGRHVPGDSPHGRRAPGLHPVRPR